MAEMLAWEGRVVTRLGAYKQSDRVLFDTIGAAVPRSGTVAFTNQVIERLEAKLGKLRMITGRAYESEPDP